MKSYKLEYLRFGNPKGGILRAGDPYLIMRGSNPVEPKDCPFDQHELLKILYQMRYNNKLKKKDSNTIISELSSKIKEFFIEIEDKGEYPLQIDLVLNANELGLIPFESILDEKKKPLFVSREKPIILTRRIRQDYFISKEEHWPIVPRVLFAYANPNYDTYHEVPNKAHEESLKWALRHWMDETASEGNDGTLTILDNANIKSITKALERANNKNNNGDSTKEKPITHLHILAHGALIPDDDGIPNNAEYGLALYSDNKKPTRFKEITDLLGSLDNKPFVVSYMICDGANNINPLQHERNIVQVTHEVGVPIVLGSQLPLTFEGSIQITDDFYKGIFDGEDVRNAIHTVRCNLFDNKRSHDWLSLVSYVRLPEGYEDYLDKNSLKRDLAALENIRKKSEVMISNNSSNSDDFEELIFALNEKVTNLMQRLQKVETQNEQRGVFEENAGLLGSAYKRWAELIFYRDKALKKDMSLSFKEQEPILYQALEWYKKAADFNLSHHWSTVQYISIQTILNGKLAEPNYWYAALQSAMNDSKMEDEIWAYGSLAELYLLSPFGEKKSNLQKARTAIKTLVMKANKTNDPFYVESTRKQLLRYAEWWTIENGFNIRLNYFTQKDIEKLIDLL